MRRRSFPSVMLATLVALCALVAPAGEDDPGASRREGPFELVGLLNPGFASVPWHASFSADGRWFAIVEGHPTRFVAVHDARTRRRTWRLATEVQPAAHRPAFTRDGERLVLVEGDALVVRKRVGNDWTPAGRVPLGFRPGIGSRARPIVLSPDERVALLVNDGRAHRVRLDSAGAAVETFGIDDVVATHFLGSRIALARWSASVAETRILLADRKEVEEILPFCVLAASGDGRTWLVARAPRAAGPGPRRLHLLDASTHAVLGTVPVEADGDRAVLTSVVFSPGGRHLVTVENLRTGTVRDARTARLIQRVRLYEGDRMIGAVFGADGRDLVTAGRRSGRDVLDASILRWRLRADRATRPWRERLRTILYERQAPDGSLWGRDRLDPLLDPDRPHLLEGASHREAIAGLEAFLADARDARLTALDRALIQRDLWAIFDGVIRDPSVTRADAHAPAREALAGRLARAMALVAPLEDEISNLPDTLARAIASRAHPAAWDPENPARPYLPPGLLDPEGPWVCLGDGEGRFLAPFHLRKRRGRAAFTVHVRLPGGRAATLAWIDEVRKALAGRKGEVHVPSNGPMPDPPRGTQFLLMRHALLVDNEGRPRTSPLVERIQIRVHGAGTGREEPRDAVFEWSLDVRPGIAGQAPRLIPASADERAVVFFEGGNGGDLFDQDEETFRRRRPRTSRLSTCASCHAPNFGAHRIQSVTHSLGPIGPLPLAIRPSTAAHETASFVRWKRSRPDFARLAEAFDR